MSVSVLSCKFVLCTVFKYTERYWELESNSLNATTYLVSKVDSDWSLMSYNVTDLEWPWLWEVVALGHCEQGPGGWLWPGCVRLPGEMYLGGHRQHSSFAVSHTVGSHTGHHLQKTGEKEKHRMKNTGAKAVHMLSFCIYTLISTWAGATASEIFLCEQAQGSAIHLKSSLLRPAQWVLLLCPVEPVGNVILIPQWWVYS